ncbi:MAG: type II toxin-antitoxin system HicB family antitoxin [Chloroflexi bacterium]|nr:type II toxin-antitoxin system HicB family antitoxin [Chloroflexota bacterium]
MKTYRFAVVVEKDQNGYFVSCPQLQGCYTQGQTFEEALENIKDAIKLHVEDRLANKEPIPIPDVVSLSTLEVAV